MRTFSLLSAPLLAAALALVGAGEARAQAGNPTIPANTIVYVTLDQPISSATAKVGQQVTATVSPDDLSGFPTGTRFQGRVTRVSPANGNNPGVIGMDFQTAMLPDPERVPIRGQLAPLSPYYSTRDSNGRMYARHRGHGNPVTPIWVGAAGGALLSTITGGNFLTGALLGGLGGVAYGAVTGNSIFGGLDGVHPGVVLVADTLARGMDADLTKGMPFGIQLERPVTFRAKSSYKYPQQASALGNARVMGARETPYGTATVEMQGKIISFDTPRPLNVNGVPYFPLQPLAQAAGMQFTHPMDTDAFTLQTPLGMTQGTAGVSSATFAGNNAELMDPPLSINGDIYVTPEFLSRATGWSADWDPTQLRLTLAPGSPV